jgi:hypothetical protein
VRVWIESRLQSSGDSSRPSGTATPAADGGVTADIGKEMEGLGLGDAGVAEYGDRESRGLPKDYEGVSLGFAMLGIS